MKNNRIEKISSILHRHDIDEDLLEKQSADLLSEDLNYSDADNFTVLMIETLKGNVDAVKLLISHGASTEIENDAGETALHLAIEQDHFGLVEALLEYSDINHVNQFSDTPLEIAKYYGYTSIINLLRINGAIDTNKPTRIQEIEDDAFGKKHKSGKG